MKNGIAEIDHLLTKVEQPDLAAERFIRLGFTVTPMSNIESMGLCNRLVLFEPLSDCSANFIELMGVTNSARVPPGMADLLHGPEGIRSMVMATTDAHAARAELVANGYPFGDVHHIAREWVLPDQRLQVEFDVLLPVPAPFAFNVCRYFSRQHYIRPEWTRHANGIRHLDAVYCIANEPRQAVRFYEDLFGVVAAGSDEQGWHVSPGQVQLTVFSPEMWEKKFGVPAVTGFAGYRLRSNDLATTRAFLSRTGIELLDGPNGDICLPPASMLGNLVHIC
jgi:Glyoxalase-like domain